MRRQQKSASTKGTVFTYDELSLLIQLAASLEPEHYQSADVRAAIYKSRIAYERAKVDPRRQGDDGIYWQIRVVP